MIHTPTVLNKAQHIVNKIERVCHCSADVWVATNDTLEDSEFAHLIDESYNTMYAFEIAVDGKITPYMKHQVKYLNRWLAKYNSKHSTKFTCLGLEGD